MNSLCLICFCFFVSFLVFFFFCYFCLCFSILYKCPTILRVSFISFSLPYWQILLLRLFFSSSHIYTYIYTIYRTYFITASSVLAALSDPIFLISLSLALSIQLIVFLYRFWCMCSFCIAHIWPTATARNILPAALGAALPLCVDSTPFEAEATAVRLLPPPPEPPLPFAVADAVLEARRFEKNFSLMARAEYLCSMNVGEICIGVVAAAADDDDDDLTLAVATVDVGVAAAAAVGLLYLAAAIAGVAGVVSASAGATVATCLLLLSLLLVLLLLLLLLLVLLLMMGEQE